MGPLTRRWPLLCAALAAGVLITGSTSSGAGAKTAPESSALLQLYAAESALARSQAELARLETRSAELARDERGARQRTEIVRRSLAASQQRVAILLRELYVQGEPDPIAVILGATSLDEAMAGIEGLARSTAQNERLGREAERQARRLEQLRADLAVRHASLDRARNEARAGAERLAAAVAGQRATVATIRRTETLTTQRLTTLQSQARAAEQRSEDLTQAAAQSTEGAPEAPARPRPRQRRPRPPRRPPPGREARRRRRRLSPPGPDRERSARRDRGDRGRPDRDPARHAGVRPRLRAGSRGRRRAPRSRATSSTSGCRARPRPRPGGDAPSRSPIYG